MPKPHPFSRTAGDSYDPKIVKVVLPAGWQVHVSQGPEFKVELLGESAVLAIRSDGPGDGEKSSPSPK